MATTRGSGETIEDFGHQWTRYDHSLGPLESEAYLADILGPLMRLDEINGRDVADIGAGNGRFTTILAARAHTVLSVEPSAAMRNNQARNGHLANVTFQQVRAEDLAVDSALDIVFCIGVLHHIPEMDKALLAMRRALRPGGRVVLWLYGREGNELYLALVAPLRLITFRLPDAVLQLMASMLVVPLKVYRFLCRQMPRLPMARYVNSVLALCDDAALRLSVFDQLNPRTARYLTRVKIRALLERAGLTEAQFYHRHGYSWTVVAWRAPEP